MEAPVANGDDDHWVRRQTIRSAASPDLVLAISHEDLSDAVFCFEVDSAKLRAKSPYFATLLDPSKFREGQRFERHVQEVDGTDALPTIEILHVGNIALSNPGNIPLLLGDFLSVLHDVELDPATAMPLTNIANLLVVADMFSVVPVIRDNNVIRKAIQRVEAKTLSKGIARLNESMVRKILFIGLLCEQREWVRLASKWLIVKGSECWTDDESDVAEEKHGLWWELPGGIEDELRFRRQMVAETLDSIPLHFIKLYSSGERQCRLGYDSSMQCDTYQLGEMIRFFERNRLISIAGRVAGTLPPNLEPGRQDMDLVLESMKKAPAYQINEHHSHCGLRSRLMPLINSILQGTIPLETLRVSYGICLDCWLHDRPVYAWLDAKRPFSWVPTRDYGGPKRAGCMERHGPSRDMFLAVERIWTT